MSTRVLPVNSAHAIHGKEALAAVPARSWAGQCFARLARSTEIPFAKRGSPDEGFMGKCFGGSDSHQSAAFRSRACAHALLKLVDSVPSTALLALAIFWTLMVEDIRIGAEIPMAHDANLAVVTSMFFFLFCVEIVVSLLLRPLYYRSIYFPFDLVSTATIIVEIPWLLDKLGDGKDGVMAFADAAQVTRILRIARLIRLVRALKLYRACQARRNDDGESSTDNPSVVGLALQDTITLQVFVGVLVMLVVFPLLSIQSLRKRIDFEREAVSEIDACWRLHVGSAGANASAAAFGDAATFLLQDAERFLDLVFFQASDGSVLLRNSALMPPNVRASEYELVSAGPKCAQGGECSTGGFMIKVDLVYQARFQSGLLGFVLLLLAAGVVVFGRVSMRYCIAPIEKLFSLVNNFSNDPMRRLESFGGDTLAELNELEQSIRKIASLLQVGIGLAGRETIARCLRTTGSIDPIAVGIKVNCLFGFCDIRQFTDATECLQEQVMLFTNYVGHIVHHAVHDCGGFANKNIGDAFLVAWTGDDLTSRIQAVERSSRTQRPGGGLAANELELAEGSSTWQPTVGDRAMAAFIRLTICVRGATHITELVQNPVLQKRLPGYTVRLGCGLHVGWAIEGALGSQKKIDATYLSPATNIAMALEGATKQYGNLLLISEDTYKLFSPFVRKLVRHIDRVYANEGAEPFNLYTYDCPTSLKVHPDEASEKAMLEHVFTYELAVTPKFRHAFHAGLEHYLKGEWLMAKALLENANEGLLEQAKTDRNLDAPDKPTMALLKFMARTDCITPDGWAGCRELE